MESRTRNVLSKASTPQPASSSGCAFPIGAHTGSLSKGERGSRPECTGKAMWLEVPGAASTRWMLGRKCPARYFVFPQTSRAGLPTRGSFLGLMEVVCTPFSLLEFSDGQNSGCYFTWWCREVPCVVHLHPACHSQANASVLVQAQSLLR